MTTTTIRTFKDWGYYLKPETNIHLIQSLADLIGWSKYYMNEEIPDYIAIYQDDQLIGGWEEEADAEPDYENGGYIGIHCGFSRIKPNSFYWDRCHHCTQHIKFNV